ncbi:LysE family translocator [Vibrio anguillarum]|jgi:threonine efflux protein|uniref:LysE family translocator n=4 Tax=Vibrio TaxID=662 RepID=A0A1E5FLF5_VIBAN|nr:MULTISPECIES: LysE family translocator [Vibrio]ASO27906.1 LysE family translocator [Vibrio anguillarum]MBF4282343.1 LysE family translocator [Vibrio anguillarum]MBF4288279.1 LysE family translocator [Vibrio anguillarum]MBF4340300.1 LysE family translocator [Vibrio anguillarum]MBF4356273.1 LysE family translocator [Vibrio anguillarum]
MNELSILATLAGVHFMALLSPGPDVALVVQNSTRYGRRTGVFIALGLSCGIVIHSLLSLTGISYLVHQQPALFAMVQLAGGGYLFYLGLGALKSIYTTWRSPQAVGVNNERYKLIENQRQAFSRGFITNIFNPKALVFFISLMSSLVPVGMSFSGKGIALLILWGLSFMWFSTLAWMLSTARLQKRLQSLTVYIDAVCGIIFTLIGGLILLQALLSLSH